MENILPFIFVRQSYSINTQAVPPAPPLEGGTQYLSFLTYQESVKQILYCPKGFVKTCMIFEMTFYERRKSL